MNKNLSYEKGIYKMDGAGGDVSVNADGVRLYKKRKKAVEELKRVTSMENLWECIVVFENYPFKTISGLDFTYIFKLNRYGKKGNEILVSRKAKTITRSSVEIAFDKVMETGALPVKMATPKELNVFGASYIYPLFIRFGLVEHTGDHRRGGRRKKTEAVG